jgi:hypothetical protein
LFRVKDLSKSKQKGTLAETAVADLLRKVWPTVERRALAGVNDKGDIAGIPKIVIEVKNQKSYKISEWLKETSQERLNAEADYGILVIKPNGVGVSRVEDWWTVLPLRDLITLLRQAGYDQGLHSRSYQGNADLSDLREAR